MTDFYSYNQYAFLFAHPDDEIYTCAFIHKLMGDGKKVDVIYVTSGDYQGPEMQPVREAEVQQSMGTLGVPSKHIHFIRIPERELMGRVQETRDNLLSLTKTIQPDCIIGHDFEGGHNGHDAVSFCSFFVANELHLPLYVFPAYHGWPEKRVWNIFASGEPTKTLVLTPEMKILQDKVIDVHASQKIFFNSIKQSDSYSQFSDREVLKQITQPIDYSKPPTDPVGYEYPGSKIRFADFKASIGL